MLPQLSFFIPSVFEKNVVNVLYLDVVFQIDLLIFFDFEEGDYGQDKKYNKENAA